MQRIAKVAGIVVAAYLVVMLASGLFIKMVLTDGVSERVTRVLDGRLPMKVAASGGDFDLLAWLRLQPSFTLRQLRISNPEGFSPEPMLASESVSAVVSLFSVLGNTIRVNAIVVREPELRIEADRNGQTNIAALFSQFAPADETPAETQTSEDGRQLAIDSLRIENGTLQYAGPDMPPFVVQNVNVELSNLSTDDSFDLTASASLLGSEQSTLQFTGRGGPRSRNSLPASGNLRIELAPATIPAETRAEYFGNFLGSPPDGSRIALETKMDGDLLKEFSGDGSLTFTDLAIGRDADHRLPLSGQAPLRIETRTLLGNPHATLDSQSATLSLGQGQWNGSLHLGYAAPAFDVASTGSIEQVNIGELLGALTTSGNLVDGQAEIPRYTLRTSGKNAGEMRNNLTGSGSVDVHQGRVALFDLAASIESRAKQMLTGEQPAAGETSFLTLHGAFQIANQRVDLSDLALHGDSIGVTGGGYFTFGQELHLNLDAAVRGAIAGLLRGKAGSDGVPVTSVPVTVTGTFDHPSVRPDIARAAADRAIGLFQSLFGGSSDKSGNEVPP